MNEAGYTVGDTNDPKKDQGDGGGRGVESGGGQGRGVGLGQRFLEDKRGLPGFPYAESHVAYRLGLNKNEMRALRQRFLVEGPEFCRDKKGRILLSIGGAEKACASLGLISEKAAQGEPGAQHTPLAEKARQAEADREWEEMSKDEVILPEALVLVRTNLKNRHMVLACRQGELKGPEDWRRQATRTGLLRVRVRSQEGLRGGMVLEAVRVEGYEDLYDLVPGQLRRNR